MKKRSLLCLFIIAISLNNFGQFDKQYSKGNLLCGGSIGVDGKKIEVTDPNIATDIEYSEKEFDCDLRLGIFVSNYLATGIKADIFLHKTKYQSEATVVQNDILIAPFIRLYSPIGLFGEASYGFGTNKIALSNSTDGDKKVINAWNLGLGYSLFISKCVAIEPMVSYDVRNETRGESPTNKKLKGFNANIGIHLYIKPSNK